MTEPFFAVLAVFGLLGMALLLLRQRGLAAFSWPRRARRGGSLEVLERVPLTPQHSLHLVKAGEHILLIAASPGGCSRIARLGSDSLAEPSPELRSHS